MIVLAVLFFEQKKRIKYEKPCKKIFLFEKLMKSTLDETIAYQKHVEPYIQWLSPIFCTMLKRI